MEIYRLEKDLKLFSVQAESFPHDIKKAFDKLVSLLPGMEGRNFFGISYQTDSGEIIYKAAVEQTFEGEGEKLGCESLVLQKGEYISEMIHDWMKDVSSIGACFGKLVNSRPDIVFPCVECYMGPDVRCMVRLDDQK